MKLTDSPIDFIRDWNHTSQSGARVYLRAETQDDLLFGVEMRFSGQRFRSNMSQEIFNQMRNRIFTASKGLVQVTSSLVEFDSGILHVAVLFCNHGYNPRIIVETLNFILRDILPNIAR